jgi:hypothetical protein
MELMRVWIVRPRPHSIPSPLGAVTPICISFPEERYFVFVRRNAAKKYMENNNPGIYWEELKKQFIIESKELVL